MVYTEEFIEETFNSSDVSGKALTTMISIAGVTHTKICDELKICMTYLWKILKDMRKATSMRITIKNYLYEAAKATTLVLQNKIAA